MQKTAYELRISDWSSDLCSSDLEDGRRELGAIDDGVKAAFEQADQILARIALHPRRFDIVLLELLFGDVAVIALQLLLGAQLDAIIGHLEIGSASCRARVCQYG